MAAVAGPIAGAAIGGLFNMAGGKRQADAAKFAAQLQSQAAEKALDFTKHSAESDWRNWETSRHANYDQWRAREGRLGTLGQLIGMPDREIPDYVPGVDPQLDRSVTSGQPAQYMRSMRELV